MQSINPYTKLPLGTYENHTPLQVVQIIEAANRAFIQWSALNDATRRNYILEIAEKLEARKELFASLITSEMGKPITESRAEIEKCIWLCKFYSQNQVLDLLQINIETEATKTYITYEPVGVLFAIMPWNFPFWQVLRFAIPMLAAGNTIVLKHAPNVTGCAKALELLFSNLHIEGQIFKAVIIPAERSEEIIGHPFVKGVTLTGSENAGKAVASVCAKYLKKNVLELGGSDPFIIFPDANLETSFRTATLSRMLNAGQVCIAAKRMIVHHSIYDLFIDYQVKALNSLILGDPLNEKTQIGPMARPDLVLQIEQQVNDAVQKGATIVCGGKRSPLHNQMYEPTLICNVKAGMQVFDDETFGPVMTVIPFETPDEALAIANGTRFGLGASIWTSNYSFAENFATKIEAGSIFVNSLVKSDPRLPFGGCKNSGYGRELTAVGVKEFMNIKTNWIQ